MACGGLWCDNDIQNVMERLSKIKAKGAKVSAIKAQIQVREIFLSIKGSDITLTKTSVEDMVTYLENLLETPVPEDRSVVAVILSDHRYLVGKHFQQKWDNGDKVTDFFGEVVEVIDKEYRLRLPDSDGEDCYLTVAEIVVDIVGGNFTNISDVQ